MFTRGWHARATTHTCDHRGPTSRFSASSMCLLGFRVACVESSPMKLPFDCFSVEAPQQRSRKIDWGLLDVFRVYGFAYCNWKENAPRQSQIHRGNKTNGSIILGTSCLLLSLVRPHATVKDAKMPTTVVGQLFSGVKFLNRSGLSSCVCLSYCRGACCLHVFVQSPSHELTPLAGAGFLLGPYGV